MEIWTKEMQEFVPECFAKERFKAIDEAEIKDNLSPFGNDFVGITQDDISALMSGKILWYNNGEYCTLIKFMKDKEN